MYSNIPHDDGIKACDHFILKGGKSQEARSVIAKLVLTKSIFQFKAIGIINFAKHFPNFIVGTLN